MAQSSESAPAPKDNLAQMDMLISIDFTKPEGSDDRYTATIVPKYEPQDADLTSEEKKFYFGKVNGQLITTWLTEGEYLPLAQEIVLVNGNGPNANEAAIRAYGQWLISQQIDGIDYSGQRL